MGSLYRKSAGWFQVFTELVAVLFGLAVVAAVVIGLITEVILPLFSG